MSNKVTLEVVKGFDCGEGVYLDNYRIAGTKPMAGGSVTASWSVDLDDLAQAITQARVHQRDQARARFGQRVKTARKEKGWSLRWLAEKMRLSHVHLSKVERGKSGLTTANRARLCRMLKIKLGDTGK